MNEPRARVVRGDSDFSATPFKAKISNAERSGSHPPPHVVGYGWLSSVAIPRGGTGAVSVRLHHGGPQGAKPKAEVVANMLASSKEQRV